MNESNILDQEGLEYYTERLIAYLRSLSQPSQTGVESFNNRSGIVIPQAGDYTASMVGAVPTTRTVNGKALSDDITLSASDVSALPSTGGTLSGDLTIKGSGNYGTKINLGDGDYVHISEPEDDCMEIKAKKVNFVLSDTSNSKFTVNGSNPFGSSNGYIMTMVGVESGGGVLGKYTMRFAITGNNNPEFIFGMSTGRVDPRIGKSIFLFLSFRNLAAVLVAGNSDRTEDVKVFKDGNAITLEANGNSSLLRDFDDNKSDIVMLIK